MRRGFVDGRDSSRTRRMACSIVSANRRHAEETDNEFCAIIRLLARTAFCDISERELIQGIASIVSKAYLGSFVPQKTPTPAGPTSLAPFFLQAPSV